MAVSCSLLTLVMLVPAILAATATTFYKHNAYGDEAAWSLGDYSLVLRSVHSVQLTPAITNTAAQLAGPGYMCW